ncbi:helix-turn-helix domain-containing protein [uncultured Desulfovibrio sp.]|uniref:helix-turn-helix domain-containing protein n=1 Tax=uncultured Desulfovibrio sp. TaxID=167968 RepID=UPI00345DDEE8
MNERSAVVNEKDQNQWLTEVDVSLLTKISLSTLRAHRFYRKGMPYSKVGRSVRYSLADVAAFMESRRVTIENA